MTTTTATTPAPGVRAAAKQSLIAHITSPCPTCCAALAAAEFAPIFIPGLCPNGHALFAEAGRTTSPVSDLVVHAAECATCHGAGKSGPAAMPHDYCQAGRELLADAMRAESARRRDAGGAS